MTLLAINVVAVGVQTLMRHKMNYCGDGGMGMARSKAALIKLAYASGWKCRNGKTLCPECVKESQ